METLKTLLKWLVSSDSAGILTISTGLIAWCVYSLQVKLREEEATIVLLNEIRHAEDSLKIITTSGFDVQNEMVSILPTCSWDNNYQIFTRYLTRDDFRLLSDFFNACKAAQSELNQWRRYFVISREEKGKMIQNKLVELAHESVSDENYQENKKKIINQTNKEDYLFNFDKPEKYFLKYVQSIPQISGTTILMSLNKLSK